MPVSFNNIPSGIKVPLFYAEVDNSAANTSTGTNKSLLIGQMMSSGTATAGTPVVVSTVSQAKTLFGRGSMLARMVEKFRASAPMEVLWCVPLADATGSVAATATLTFSGTATASGTVFVYIGSVRTSTGVAKNDTDSAVATAVAATINANLDLPVTASSNLGVVTLTAKNKGTLGNDMKAVVNFAGTAAGESLPDGISCVATAFASGATDPTVSSAFTAIGEEPFEFIGMPYSDTTSLDAAKSAMNDSSGRWSYLRQLYGHVYTAMRGSSSTLATAGALRNDQHATIFGIEANMLNDCAEVVGAALGRTAVYISNDPARPTQTGVLVDIVPPDIQNRFTMSERQTLLTSGIATLVSQSDVMIERAITTYQTNAYGDADNSYYDSETLHTLSYVIKYLRSIITSKYARHKLANDGTRYGAGQAVVTPSVIRGELIAAYKRLEYKAIVENAEVFAKHLIVERNVDDPNRLDVLFPPDLVNQLRVFALLAQFRLQYNESEAE